MLRKLLPILILAAVVVMFSSDLYAGVTKVKIKDAQAKERIPDEATVKKHFQQVVGFVMIKYNSFSEATRIVTDSID